MMACFHQGRAVMRRQRAAAAAVSGSAGCGAVNPCCKGRIGHMDVARLVDVRIAISHLMNSSRGQAFQSPRDEMAARMAAETGIIRPWWLSATIALGALALAALTADAAARQTRPAPVREAVA